MRRIFSQLKPQNWSLKGKQRFNEMASAEENHIKEILICYYNQFRLELTKQSKPES
jgi:hypothetical protein